jgi:PAS domain S-box-containing protein
MNATKSDRPPAPAGSATYPMLGLGLIGVAMAAAALIVYANWVSSRHFDRNAPLIRLSDVVQQKVALAHLWFEEALANDDSIRLDRDVYAPLDQARDFLDAALNGGMTTLGRVVKVEAAAARRGLLQTRDGVEQMRRIVDTRWRKRDTTGGTGGRLDQELDATFKRIITGLDAVATELNDVVDRDRNTLSLINAALLAIFLVILAVTTITVMRSRRAAEARNRELARRVEERTARLADSEARTRAILGTAADGVITLDEAGVIESFNQAAAKMFDRKTETVLGARIDELLPKQVGDRPGDWRSFPVDGSSVETFGRRRDGTVFPLELAASEVVLADRRTFTWIVRDVTARKAAEAVRLRLERAISSTAEAVMVTDRGGHIQSVNPAFTTITGYPEDEALGRRPRILKSGKVPAAVYREMWDTITRGKVWQGNVQNRRKDGRLFHAALTISPILGEGGDCQGYVGVQRDVTSELEAKEALERMNADLARARDAAEAGSRAKSQFLANMSHEIRTPLNAIIGLTSLLLDAELDAEQRDLVAKTHHSSEALLTIVDDILDFSKIEAGKMELEPVDFVLEDVVTQAVDLVSGPARDKGLEIAPRIGDDVPTRVRGDAGRLRQVLINLLGNAVKFTVEGEVELQVTADPEAGSSRHRVRFAVRDTGIGVPPESRPHLFRPFSQADGTTTRRHGGTGLGLAISRELVELMGGVLDFTSRPGRGSTFWFTIPLEPVRTAPVAASHPVTPESIDAAGAGRPVLVVEDHALNREVVIRMLERLGYTVEVAANGREAVEFVRRRAPHAILMDCHMPEMDGYAATREIRRLETDGRHVPIIALTANAVAGDRARALESGVDEHLVKPVTLERLGEVLGRWSGSPAEEGSAPLVAARVDPPDGQARAVLDLAVIERLGKLDAGGDPAFVDRMIDLFLEETPARLQRIDSALDSDDVAAVLDTAHTLKGAAGNVGACAVVARCAALARAARAGELPRARYHSARLAVDVEETRRALDPLRTDGER